MLSGAEVGAANKKTLTKMTQETTHILRCKDFSPLDAFDIFADIDANFMHHRTACRDGR